MSIKARVPKPGQTEERLNAMRRRIRQPTDDLKGAPSRTDDNPAFNARAPTADPLRMRTAPTGSSSCVARRRRYVTSATDRQAKRISGAGARVT